MFRLKSHFHYFSQSINKESRELYYFTLLNALALSMVFIFEPIYLYTEGFSLIQILLFYAMVYSWYALLITLGAKFAARFGFKRAIMVSNIFYIIYWLTLYFIQGNAGWFVIAPVFFALQKSFFWPAYEADIALSQGHAQRGRESGLLGTLAQIAFVLGPVLGGIISKTFGFGALFLVAGVTMLLSALPLFRSPEIFSSHTFKFVDLLNMIKTHKQNFFGYWGYAEDLMIQSLWPIYMFMVVPDIRDLGLVSAIATIIGGMLMLYVGRLIDRLKTKKFLSTTAIVYGATWFFRFLARDLGSLLALDALTKGAKDVINVSINSLGFSLAGDRGSDKALAYSVFWEFSLSVGKVVTALSGVAILVMTGNVYLVFMVAGGLTWFYGFLRKTS